MESAVLSFLPVSCSSSAYTPAAWGAEAEVPPKPSAPYEVVVTLVGAVTSGFGSIAPVTSLGMVGPCEL